MSTDNPYQSSGLQPPGLIVSPKILVWSLGVLAGTTVLGGIGGTVVGYGLGKLVPGYYRSVFNNGSAPGFDPVAVGIGQGLTQGIGAGVVTGLVLVALYYRFNKRVIRSLMAEYSADRP